MALMGNPNSGKTAIFNLLTGMNLKVSNYPGITVEMCRGTSQLSKNHTIDVIDMPSMAEGKKNKKQVNGNQLFN